MILNLIRFKSTKQTNQLMGFWQILKIGLNNMVYVFDIDNTICITHGSDYENSEPYKERISKINNLYDSGHTIIMMTARGMGRTKQNELESYRIFYDFTFSQLKNWGVKFHKLMLGKPAADFYIDDKGVNSGNFFE